MQENTGFNPTLLQVVINLHSKYEHSTLHVLGVICDEKFQFSKYGRKKKNENTRKNKQEMAGYQSHFINRDTKYEHSSLYSLGEIFDENIHFSQLEKIDNRTNTGNNKQEKLGSQSHGTTCRH